MINNKYTSEYTSKSPFFLKPDTEYTGAYYRIVEDAFIRRKRLILLWAGAVLSFFSFGFNMYVSNDVCRLFYVVMPYACVLLIWVYMLFAIIGYSGKVDKLEHINIDRIVNRLKKTSISGAILSGLAFIATFISFAAKIVVLSTLNIAVTALIGVTCGAFVLVFVVSLKFVTDTCPAE